MGMTASPFIDNCMRACILIARPIMDRSRNATTFRISRMKEWHYADSAIRSSHKNDTSAVAVARYRVIYHAFCFLFFFIALTMNWISLKCLAARGIAKKIW